MASSTSLPHPGPNVNHSVWPVWARRIATVWGILVFWSFFLLFFPLYVVFLLVPLRTTFKLAHGLNLIWGWWIVYGSGIWLKVEGKAPAAADGPYIYVSNHASYLDIPILHVAVPRQYRFLGKHELARVPLFGFMYRRLHLIMDRQNVQQAARSLLLAGEALKRGESLVIFPEGTTHTGDRLLGNFKDGAFHLAAQYQVPIVPITLIGTKQRFASDGKWLLQPGLVTVRIHPALQPEGLSLQDLKAQTRQILETSLRQAYGSE